MQWKNVVYKLRCVNCMTKYICISLNIIIIILFFRDQPNSLGSSNNQQQHGNRLKMKTIIYLFPLFILQNLLKKKRLKIIDNSVSWNNNFGYSKHFSIEHFRQRLIHVHITFITKDTNIRVTLGTLFGGFFLGVIVTAVVTILMYKRLKFQIRKRSVWLLRRLNGQHINHQIHL